jgi:S-adenosylmethionine:tRNA ribosyltransferase-isomerase
MLLRSPLSQAELHALLVEAGETPLPPYITSTAAEQLKREQYQSMFAKNVPSVAAPTASLHFTSELVQVLAKQGSSFANVTLQVGLGTFAPVFEEHFEAKRLHREQYVIPQATIASITEALSAAQPIMAVGTTVVRTLEAAKEYLALSGGANSRLSDREVSGSTELFIYPPYDFTYPDILLTNFHVSRSSLMCLVQAYLDHKGAKRPLTELYQLAIDERMRFYSFGDAMLIL